MNKRWLSLTTTVALILSLLPVGALAAGEEPAPVVTQGEVYADTLQTTAFPTVSLYGLDDGTLTNNGTSHVDWFDRITFDPEVQTAMNTFYQALVNGSNPDGGAAYLIDDSYYSFGSDLASTGDYSNLQAGTVYRTANYTGIYVGHVSAAPDSSSVTYWKNSITATYHAFDRDHPEVFWLGNGSRIMTFGIGPQGQSATDTYLFFALKQSDFDIRDTATYNSGTAITSAIDDRDSAINTIMSDSEYMSATTDVAKVTYFDKWLTHNNEYNTTIASNPNGDATSTAWECISALSGSAGTQGPVCEGYARALKVLCDEAGIGCVLVDGTAIASDGSSGAHMWNYVEIGNNWYAVDSTWNDPTGGTGVNSGRENEDYLLVGSDTEIDGRTFISSHPVSNQVSTPGVAFTNGPKLEPGKYTPSAADQFTIQVASNLVYDDSAVTAGTGDGYDITYTYSGAGAVTVKWYADNGGTQGALLGTDGSTAPTDAGTYWIGLSVDGIDDEATKQFTIAPKSIAGATVTLGSDALTYNGTQQGPTITSVMAGDISVDSNSYTVTGNTQTNAGSYTLTITANEGGNFTGSVTQTWTIAKKAVTVTVDAATRAYGEANPTFTGQVTGGSLVGSDTYDSLGLRLTSAANATSPVGTYNVTGSGTNTNYDITVEGSGKLTVTAATQVLTVESGKLRMGGSRLDLTTLVSGNQGNLSFAISGENPTGSTIDADGKTLVSGATTGTVTITVSAAATNLGGSGEPEYAAATATLTVTITEKDNQELTVTQSGCTYGETLSDPVVSQPADAGAITYTYTGTLRKGGTYGPTSTKPTEAGTYTVTAACESLTTAYTGSADFTIAPKNIAGATVTLDGSLTYNGGQQSPTIASVTAGTTSVSVDSYTVTGNTGTNAGTYTLTITATNTGNFTGSATQTWSIAQKAITATVADIAPVDYTGKQMTPAVTVTDGSTTTLASTDYTTAYGENVNAGTGTVTVSAAANGNYTFDPVQKTFTINKIAYSGTLSADLPINAGGTGSYDLATLGLPLGTVLGTPTSTDNSAILDGAPTLNGTTLSFSVKDDAATDLVAVITVPITACTNYTTPITITINVTVTDKLPQANLVITSPTSAVFGTPLTLTTSGGSGSGAVTFLMVPSDTNTGMATIEGSTFHPTGVGTVQIYAQKAGDDTYMETVSAPVTITIAPATYTGNPIYTAITTSGKTLADANLRPNTGWDGTIKWVDAGKNDLPLTTAVTQNTSYHWLFTPNSANYSPLEGDIVLWPYTPPTTDPDNNGSGSGSSSSGSGSSSSGNKTETTTNPDGSTTTTVTKPNGTVTETTKYQDGSTEVVETQKDGTTTTTSTDTQGNKTQVVENPDGSSVTTVDNKDGSASTTTVDQSGKLTAQVTLPKKVVESAAESKQTITLPMPAVPVTSSQRNAPAVTVDLPQGATAKVEVPVENVTAGTVAVLVKADGTEEIIKTSVTTDNGVAVTLSAGDTIKLVDNSKSFADVSASYWGSDAVDFATSRELFNGTTDSTFSPNTEMSRAMIVTVLARLEGVDTTAGSSWYEAGRQWAMDKGISDGSNMDSNLSREQLAVMLYRYAGMPMPYGSISSYADKDAVSDWAMDAMCWAVENGIITGNGAGHLAPQSNASRAEVATMLMRFIQNQA